MTQVQISRGDSPLVLGLPHTGTYVPEALRGGLNETGQVLADTDWHVHDLYKGLAENITSVRTTVHRYVIDVNRDPSGASLYPGQNTTTLCPLTDFDGQPIWQDGFEPDEEEIARRLASYHVPYHTALNGELARIRDIHGFAILYDCHSIRSQVPFLFEGRLPDFNIGTNGGETCDDAIEAMVRRICAEAQGFSTILNGRFKGGWTTRHYGRPAEGLHAIQMELAQSAYMLERPPWTRDDTRTERLRMYLATILQDLKQWRPR